MSDVKTLWEIPAQLGEGPLWDEQDNAVYWWISSTTRCSRYGLADGAKTSWKFDFEVTSLSRRASGGFVGTIKEGFAEIDFSTLSAKPIELPEAGVAGNRFNDGKVDNSGRYWAGTMDIDQVGANGALYRMDATSALAKPMAITSSAMDRPSASTTASSTTRTA